MNRITYIDPINTALLLIEYQREWLSSSGKLNSLCDDRTQLERAVVGGREALHTCRGQRIQVIHSGLQFTPGHPELGKSDLGLREAIPRVGTFVGRHSDFEEGFEPAAGDLVVKGRLGASAFAGSNLDALLRNRRIDTLLIAGFALHVCVESTLRQAHDLGYRAIVLEDACAAFTRSQREHVLQHVVHHFGASVSNARLADVLARASSSNGVAV